MNKSILWDKLCTACTILAIMIGFAVRESILFLWDYVRDLPKVGRAVLIVCLLAILSMCIVSSVDANEQGRVQPAVITVGQDLIDAGHTLWSVAYFKGSPHCEYRGSYRVTYVFKPVNKICAS